ncbi:DUF4873 domain-containing protein [Yinghuangia seranimata]|uniref:DUF4873 domain-containing protein n=1 Tax=Yinghuangia seranimata TaxID=408067 RepID=UPI00248C29D6|nr:DUF4873 domain-containing protein [Yinghuangia seranimata]MDI2124611.1 DUF4873 domain-containing protein [Yinghuangia seranimata]
MENYAGTATILAGGTSYPCTAELVAAEFGAGGTAEWGGRLSVEDPDTAWAVTDAADPHVRLDGGEGPFTVAEVEGDTVLRIVGAGPVPWRT